MTTPEVVDRFHYLVHRKIVKRSRVGCPKKKKRYRVGLVTCKKCDSHKGLSMDSKYVLCLTDIRWKKNPS